MNYHGFDYFFHNKSSLFYLKKKIYYQIKGYLVSIMLFILMSSNNLNTIFKYLISTSIKYIFLMLTNFKQIT